MSLLFQAYSLVYHNIKSHPSESFRCMVPVLGSQISHTYRPRVSHNFLPFPGAAPTRMIKGPPTLPGPSWPPLTPALPCGVSATGNGQGWRGPGPFLQGGSSSTSNRRRHREFLRKRDAMQLDLRAHLPLPPPPEADIKTIRYISRTMTRESGLKRGSVTMGRGRLGVGPQTFPWARSQGYHWLLSYMGLWNEETIDIFYVPLAKHGLMRMRIPAG